MYKINDKEYECPVALTIEVFNDKWKLLIIWNLLDKEKRFKDLCEIFQDISQKTLTIKLKELEKKHLIHREAFAEIPPKVVYSLTSAGKGLRILLEDMHNWGIAYVEEYGEVSGDTECSKSGHHTIK